MNISFKHILQKSLVNILQPRRAQVYVGFQCHQRCGFCYYQSRCNEKMFSVADVKRQIDFEYLYGIRAFELTGGEPSEYLRLRQICQYIKSFGDTKVAIITNGGLWKSDIWDLIDEVLVSYHISQNANSYSRQMFPLGSTYDKVKQTIETAHKHHVIVRTNTVVGTFNIDDVTNIVSDLIQFHPFIINFLPVNMFDQATSMHQYINYEILRQKLKTAITTIVENLANPAIYVRYMPFCDMEGYEQHLVGHVQHIYDWFDWNRELDGISVIEYSKKPEKWLQHFGSYGSRSLESALAARAALYTKNNKCLTCKYLLICDGVEKTSNNTLLKYISPVHGRLVTDPLQYFQSNYCLFKHAYE